MDTINNIVTGELQYDGTFDGLLSVVFEIYNLKIAPTRIYQYDAVLNDLFADRDPILVSTSKEQAERVMDGIRRYGGKEAYIDLHKTFLSEDPHREMLIYQYLKLLFAAKKPINGHYHEDAVMRVSQLVRQMGREIHRMHAFVRFQELADGLYFAPIEPDFDVLPLAFQHFKDRYAAMKWCIYDIKRGYGMLYTGIKVERVVLDNEVFSSIQLPTDVLSDNELAYQQLWKDYFTSTNILERKNLKLHLRHVPTRYWKYLTEKW